MATATKPAPAERHMAPSTAPTISKEKQAKLDAKAAKLAEKNAKRAAKGLPPVAPKVKATKIQHPLVGDKTSYPFDTTPTDYSFDTHKPLGKKAFKDATGFLEYRGAQLSYRAGRMQKLAEKMINKAKIERQFGSEDMRKKARKYSAMAEEMASLRAALAAAGIDPATIQAPDATA